MLRDIGKMQPFALQNATRISLVDLKFILFLSDHKLKAGL